MANSRDDNRNGDLKSPLLLNHHHQINHNHQQQHDGEFFINITEEKEEEEGQGGADPAAAAGPPHDQIPLIIPNGCGAAATATAADAAGSDDDDHERSGHPNPFHFLFVPSSSAPAQLSLPRPSSIDPFRNHTPSVGGIYEWLKLLLTIPLALIRLLLFGLSLAVGYLATLLALQGWKDKQSPIPRWRSRIMWITRICARSILFAFGYHWIRRIGKPAPREVAPIVVSNHISYIEPIFFFYELFPTIVASESHDSLPFVGTIIRAMQVIYVDRFSAMSRKNAVSEIKRKASCNDFPHVLLFPEGTTTNGRALISFQLGAFIPLLPVQPVVIRYPHVHFDQSWGLISLAKLMFRMFTQFHNFMEVEYLPVVEPFKSKQETAVHFAERTSYAMARALNVVQTSYSYGDMLILSRAAQLTKEKCSSYLVEMALVKSSFGTTTSEAMDLLECFFAMKPDSNGRVKFQNFLTGYCLGHSRVSQKIFHYLDVENKGSITFRQFLLGSAHVRKQPLFQKACEAAFHNCTATDHISPDQLGDIIRSSMPNTIKENGYRLFHLLDIDEDGIISRDDFMMCLQRNPLLIAIFGPEVQ